MKKIIFSATMLGTTFCVNAQVGIGTPTPSLSSMLEIAANDKGVLIPRVSLVNSTTPLIQNVEQTESLLVYNTATNADLTPGFYYWVADSKTTPVIPAHWERIINQTDLDNAINNQSNDLNKIINLLNTAYGSNNLSTQPVNNIFGGMVFTPAQGTFGNANYVQPIISYVVWNPALNNNQGGYERVNITSQIIDLIKGTESKTLIITTTNGKKQYYISESYLNNEQNPEITQAIVDAWTSSTLPTGVYPIDVLNGIVNNFYELINSEATINNTSQTIKQFFDSLGEIDNNTVYFNNTNTVLNVGTTNIPSYSFYLKNNTGDGVVINLAELIKNLETKTIIDKTTVTDTGLANVVYKYYNESSTFEANGSPSSGSTANQTIDLAADLTTIFNDNSVLRNIIKNIANTGAEVFYGPIVENGSNVLYYLNGNTKTEIIIPINIDQLILTINNTNEDKRNLLKLALGDKLTTNNTSVFTGNTITIGGVLHYIYKGNFTTTVTANTANTTGINLDRSGAKVLAIDLRYDGGIGANVTDLSVSNNLINFRIGTGKMYHVLGNTNIDAQAMIEFASTEVPAGITP